MVKRDVYSIEIDNIKRELPLFEIKPGLKIAILNILGDTELIQVCAKNLAERMKTSNYDLLVTAEAKSIPLAHAISLEVDKPYIVLRKAYKLYMGDAIAAETLSITTGQKQTLYLDEKDRDLVKGKRVMIVDDVISTGSTLQGMCNVLEKAGAEVIGEAAIFTEGDQSKWDHIISIGHLPVFAD